MRWASAIATDGHLVDAVDAAADDLHAVLHGARADLVLAFVTDHHAAQFAQLGRAVERAFPGALLVGCTAGGAIGGGREIEHEPAVALTAAALPGVRLTPYVLGTDPDAWASQIDLDEGADAALLTLPDPLSWPPDLFDELLGFLDERWPDAAKIGGLASGGMTTAGPPTNTLFLGEERVSGGAIGVALEGDVVVDTIVAQGCRPIGEPMIVTRAHTNLALGLDGQPPLQALDRLCQAMTADERALARHSLFLGVSMRQGVGGGALPGRGDYLIRNLLGVDRGSGALAVAAPLAVGQVVQFHLRDAAAAATDLTELLGVHDAPPPDGALLFSCVGRGRLLYGTANHDSRVFRRAFGDVPLGGFFCNGEIGQVHRRTYLHGYTSSFALFRRKLAST